MKGNMLTIARKELAKFFANRVSALVSIVLPGLLIFVLWTFMGSAMQDMFSPDEEASPVVAVVNEPAACRRSPRLRASRRCPKRRFPTRTPMRGRIEAGEVQAFAAFPEGFDAAVAAYDPASGEPAPQVEVYANSADADSAAAASAFEAALAAYESSLSNRFDVNAGEGPYDVAEERDLASSVVVSIVPLLLLILLFSSVMSIAAESVAGEKERGTMARFWPRPSAAATSRSASFWPSRSSAF